MTLSKQQLQLLQWRRSRVIEFASKGYNQTEIARILKVDKTVICKDLAVINLQAKRNIDKFVTEKLPVEYEKCIVGLTEILKTAWTMTYQQDIDKREKLQALSLAKECYTTKLELLTNSTILADAMKFVTRHQNQQNQPNQNQKDDNGNDIKQKQKVVTEKVTKEQESNLSLESEEPEVIEPEDIDGEEEVESEEPEAAETVIEEEEPTTVTEDQIF